jgi:uncharacterized protein (DUF305 family)
MGIPIFSRSKISGLNPRCLAMTPRKAFQHVLLLILLASAGCRSTRPEPAPSTATSDPSDTAALEALYWQRLESARNRFTKADVDFMTGMIGHHAQALVMSAFAPTNEANAEIQVLAARIINAQNDEIAKMQQWLRDRGQPVPEVHIQGTTLTIHGAGEHHHTHMPGMLTDAQMNELQQARGAAFDTLYLTYMIQHHRGAVTMVDTLFATDGAGQDEAVFKLASDVNVDQLTEIARMELMLGTLSDAEVEP